MTLGKDGKLVAPLPLEAKFARDPFNEGVIGEWYAPSLDDSRWGSKNTFYLWEQQDKPEDGKGHDWDGYGWYRTTVEVPKEFAGKPVHLLLGERLPALRGQSAVLDFVPEGGPLGLCEAQPANEAARGRPAHGHLLPLLH
jgi:hypothetical protein